LIERGDKDMRSHILMIDDYGRFVWVPHFEVSARKSDGWIVSE